ncbi:MAG: sialate O-acetylesterase [Kiritimatiellales bacterium]|nr:sialate O-acetylesterase [Kiritimatiellales bacterium]MCF7864261.1 sialate O-acetylesterase [Kiritimatiellales bacterium]
MKYKFDLWLTFLLLAATGAGAAEPMYAGYYRGTTMTNGLGTVMKSGIYSFTNISDAAGSAVRIAGPTYPANNWQKMAFDGTSCFSFFRDTTANKYGGKGLYNAVAISLISSNFDSGVVYTFTNWHGIAYSDPFYYGLYNGTAMDGPGLYRFDDPTDPENGAATHLFPTQTFSADRWSDVAVDYDRYLFVKTAIDGDAGIYQYDPQADSFTRISGTETYTDWDGLGAYVAPPPPPVATNMPLLHKTIYVILFGGQSNALGWGYRQYLLDIGSPLAEPQMDVDLFTGVAMYLPLYTLTNLQSGSANSRINSGTPQYPAITNAPVSRFGPELSMGRTVRDLIHIPNSKVAVIKHAVGGTSLYKHWLPDNTADSASDGPTYQAFQITVQKGLTTLRNQYPDYGIEILGMGWVQGEADAGAHSAEYQANLTTFIQDVRATYGSNLVFVLSKLSPNQSTSANYETIRAAQQAVADADPRVVATETIGTNYLTAAGFAEGGVHYLSASLFRIGQDLGNALIAASGLDADDDGLPDSWENSYPPGTAGLGNTPDADYDGDGLTDLQEYEAGTSPVDPADGLTVSIGTGSQVRWDGKKDVRYQTLASTNLESWMEFGAPVLLRDSNSIIGVDFSPYLATNRVGFFKLQVL